VSLIHFLHFLISRQLLTSCFNIIHYNSYRKIILLFIFKLKSHTHISLSYLLLMSFIIFPRVNFSLVAEHFLRNCVPSFPVSVQFNTMHVASSFLYIRDTSIYVFLFYNDDLEKIRKELSLSVTVISHIFSGES
jgi:hypothetical protein